MKKKKSIKKNQVVIAALTVLLGVAGYINFSNNSIRLAPGDKADLSGDLSATESAFAEDELLSVENDIALDETFLDKDNSNSDNLATNLDAGEATAWDMDPEEYIELNSEEEKIGEAVLTSTGVTTNFVGMKLSREQTRSVNKEALLEIINGDGMDAQAVSDATAAYIKLTENAETEQEVESILAAKGIGDAIVSLSEDSVDVVLSCGELDDVTRAQIEDVVTRKTGLSVSQIVITIME